MGDRNKVTYRKLFYNNLARPMALFMMWLAFQERLAAKDKVLKLDMINEDNCVCYNQLESQEHLLFYCYGMQSNWKLVTSQMRINHTPMGWKNESTWVLTTTIKLGSLKRPLRKLYMNVGDT